MIPPGRLSQRWKGFQPGEGEVGEVTGAASLKVFPVVWPGREAGVSLAARCARCARGVCVHGPPWDLARQDQQGPERAEAGLPEGGPGGIHPGAVRVGHWLA